MVTTIIIAVLVVIILLLIVLVSQCAPGARSEDAKGCLWIIFIGFIIFLMYLGGKYLW